MIIPPQHHGKRKSYAKKKRVKSPKNLDKCKELDGDKCRVCGSTNMISAHHIVNKSLGGDDKLSNLITLCFTCHRKVHDGGLDFRDFLITLEEAFPKLEWFRWEESLGELRKRK